MKVDEVLYEVILNFVSSIYTPALIYLIIKSPFQQDAQFNQLLRDYCLTLHLKFAQILLEFVDDDYVN
jgi:hypothetical protein